MSFRTFARDTLAALAIVAAIASTSAACIPQDLACGGTSADLSGVTPLDAIRMNAGQTELEGAGVQPGYLIANGTNCASGEYARGVDTAGNAEGCAADQDTDTTCNDAGVVCNFAGSSSEGGAANTALALSADGSNCAVGQYARGVDAAGNAQSCSADMDTTCNDAGVSCLFAGSASEGGPATTALALNANGANCPVGEYARGVDAAGASEGCTAVGAGDTTCNDAGVVCLFAGSATEGGPATTALALNANGANCSAGNYPLGVDAAGAVESCTADDDVPEAGDFGNLTGGAGITNTAGTLATASTETDFLATGTLTCGAGTKGRMSVGTATTPGQYCDNSATPTLRYIPYGNNAGGATLVETNTVSGSGGYPIAFMGGLSGSQALGVDSSGGTYNPANNTLTADLAGNSATATALAVNGANCSAGQYPLGVNAAGAVESCTDAAAPLLFSQSSGATISSQTTLQSAMSVTLASGTTYRVQVVARHSQDAGTANLKVALDTPAAAALTVSAVSVQSGANPRFDTLTGDDSPVALTQNGNPSVVTLDGLVTTFGSGGALTYRWAQNTSNANATSLLVGSYLTAVRVQ